MQGDQEKEKNNAIVLNEKPKRKWKLTINPYLDPYQFLSYRHWTHYNLKLLKGTSTIEEQGVNSTMSNFKKIQSAEIFPDFVKFNLQPRSQQLYNLGLLIDRLQSLGDIHCHQVAENLKKLDHNFEEKKNILKKIKWKSLQEYKNEIKSQRYIMFYCPFLGQDGFRVTNILISNKLLQSLGYTEQLLILKSLKIESILIEPISGKNNYIDTILGYLKIVNNYLEQLSQNQQTFKFKPVFGTAKSKIMTAKNEYLFCDLRRYVSSPEFYCLEILDVIQRQSIDKLPEFWSKLPNTLHKLQVSDSKMLCEIGFKSNVHLRRAGYVQKMDVQTSLKQKTNTDKSVISNTQKSGLSNSQIIPE